MKKEDVITEIYKSIDEVNETSGIILSKEPDTKLFGGDSNIDSLGLVNLIVSVESNINETFNLSISLADEKAMSQKHSPFRTVETLADYIVLLINEESNG